MDILSSALLTAFQVALPSALMMLTSDLSCFTANWSKSLSASVGSAWHLAEWPGFILYELFTSNATDDK